MNMPEKHHRPLLQSIARRVMLERGLLPDFSPAAQAELSRLQPAAAPDGKDGEATNGLHDLRKVSWASIDNDDSRDLDQLTVAEALPEGRVRIQVAIADVDALVPEGSAIDDHARHNTTSVYTAAQIFPMLPEKLSTDLTSLNPDQDRLAVVIAMVIGPDGALLETVLYRAQVRNQVKLAYNNVAAWLDGNAALPEAAQATPGLEDNLRLQDQAAQRLKSLRHAQGALNLETIEARPVFDGDRIQALESEEKNRAKQIIEDFMIAANGVTARYLAAKNLPSIRRVVRVPKRWDRIVEIAAQHKVRLPPSPDPKALDQFLVRQKAADPLRFPDLSLAVIKLLGNGEYMAEPPGGTAAGHFGLAVRDYSHSTAPNRRYPDLLTQRLLKAALENKPSPYDMDQLVILAAHCTQAEDAATKVERQVEKSAAALLLQSRVGERFDGIVTGASEKGTWVRLLSVPVEGKVVAGFEGLDVGERVKVQLIDTNVERGFIDFKSIGGSAPG